MTDYEKWDEYFDGDITDELEHTPQDCIVYEKTNLFKPKKFDEVMYFGPKTNATLKQIKYNLYVKEWNDKFLYMDDATTKFIMVKMRNYSLENYIKVGKIC